MCRTSTLLAELEDDDELPEPDDDLDDNEDDLKDDEEYDDVMVWSAVLLQLYTVSEIMELIVFQAYFDKHNIYL